DLTLPESERGGSRRGGGRGAARALARRRSASDRVAGDRSRRPSGFLMATSTTERAAVRPGHAIRRWLTSIFPDGEAIEGEAPLELVAEPADPPKVAQATVIEGRTLRAFPVGEPGVAIAAFLDGRQESAVKMYRPGGVPIVA